MRVSQHMIRKARGEERVRLVNLYIRRREEERREQLQEEKRRTQAQLRRVRIAQGR